MTTLLETKPAITDGSGNPDELFHIICCDDDIALCGTDVSKMAETEPDGEPHCVVCEDLYTLDNPCGPTCKL